MSSALQAKKRKEAEENVKQAEKYLTKTMMRWTPDYLAAAPHLEKAADAYRAADDMDAAKRYFNQAASVQVRNKSSFRAAQNCENVAKVVTQQLRSAASNKSALLSELHKAYDAASSHYSDMGELGKAADALLKSAATTEEVQPTDIATIQSLYLQACGLMEAQDKPHFAVEPFRKAMSFLVKNSLFRDALELQTRLVRLFQAIDQHANVHKLYLSALVLELALGDVAAADQRYMAQLQDDAFLASDECALADDLVRAFKTGSDELLQATIKKQGFSFLDNQIARLTRKLTIYGRADAPKAAAPVVSRQQQQQQQQQQPPPAAAAKKAPVAALPPPAPVEKVASDSSNEEFDFDATAARATIAVPRDGGDGMENDLAFDMESLEFAMPSDVDVASESQKQAASDDKPAPVVPQAPMIADDDMFDLT